MAQQFTLSTLGQMQGHVLTARPGIHPSLVKDFLNQAVRWALDYRQTWSGTLRNDTIYIPASFSSGSVSVTNGSRTVTLSGATWPTNDKVNTTLAAAVTEPGRQWATLASLSGIDSDAVLAVDSGASREIWNVLASRANSILVDADYAHSNGVAVTQSSYAGRQIRIGSDHITHTIESVDSSTQLTLVNPWNGSTASGLTYEIVKMYYTIAPDIKFIHGIVDRRLPALVRTTMSKGELDYRDPMRTAGGPPTDFVQVSVGPSGNAQYELYPIQREERQLDALYSIQWPEMVARDDTPPPFINPDVFVFRAMSMAFAFKSPNPSGKDPYYDPQASRMYLGLAQEALERSAQADESKLQTMMEFFYKPFRSTGAWRGPNWSTNTDSLDFDTYSDFRWW